MLSWLFKKRILKNPELLGRWGEKYTCRYLKREGLLKLTENFSCKHGEIDLIMVDRDRTIVFVEVKTRASEEFADLESSVSYAKRKRLIKTAQTFISKNNINNRPFRFDLVFILAKEKGRPEIRHYKNAFIP